MALLLLWTFIIFPEILFYWYRYIQYMENKVCPLLACPTDLPPVLSMVSWGQLFGDKLSMVFLVFLLPWGEDAGFRYQKNYFCCYDRAICWIIEFYYDKKPAAVKYCLACLLCLFCQQWTMQIIANINKTLGTFHCSVSCKYAHKAMQPYWFTTGIILGLFWYVFLVIRYCYHSIR